MSDLNCQFISLRVKRHLFLGRPSFVLYINDYTKKAIEKLAQIRRQEEHYRTQQAENFKAVVSHEMRTPIMSIIFFIKQVIIVLSTKPLPSLDPSSVSSPRSLALH